MQSYRVFAVLCVRSISKAEPYYRAVFGREPDSSPMDTLREWYPNDGGGIQVFEEAERSGKSYATINVPDLDALVADLESRNIQFDTSGIDYTPFRLASVTDPDGNRITFAQDTR